MAADEGAADTDLYRFKQSVNNLSVQRLRPDLSLNRPNPLSEVKDIKICNSFQMNPKAKGQTIHTLMKGDFKNV